MPVFIIPQWDRSCWSFDAMSLAGQKVGWVKIVKRSNHVFIQDLYVRDEFRRFSIGEHLIAAVVHCYQAQEIRCSIHPFRHPGEGNTQIAGVEDIMRIARRFDFVSKPGEPKCMTRKPKGIR